MPTWTITELDATRDRDYKAFLHRGLREDSAMFRITVADDEAAPFPTKGRPDSFTLAVVEGQSLAGVVSFEREGANREKLRHKGLLFRMYVAPEHRGQGLGRQLIQAVIDRARALPQLERINLTVLSNNLAGKHLYARLGFRTFAVEERALFWGGQYYDEETMVLVLESRLASQG